MLNTLMLIAVTNTAVKIIICLENLRSGTMMRIRLMMIWRRSWTWIHHQNTESVSWTHKLITTTPANDFTYE
jgi:hypothetical protein